MDHLRELPLWDKYRPIALAIIDSGGLKGSNRRPSHDPSPAGASRDITVRGPESAPEGQAQ